ncbi:DUF4426 domain-containing protein [Shewanella maritima]|uniref:DUF4426 domain-containing protein n=1 Tax=Shewanella maritima TaxID=2520507 RepID=A0A411PES8_9GAMM|nr:DUF4426 domain-containing protein [Shewanella maritima]QBF81900.1 DUF4426 domain-containing protein [Shewanella maritima]
MLRQLSLALVFAALTLINASVHAEQKQVVGQFEIHYIALDSTFITPEVASTYGIKRSRYNGLVNITVLDTRQDGNPAVAVDIKGFAKNLLDARAELEFKEIREGQAIYYIAQVPFRDEEVIHFNLAIRHDNELNTSLKFKQKFYVN